MAGLPVGTWDRLCHQQALLASPSNENIDQQVPVSQPRAEAAVVQDEAVLGAGSQEEQAIVIEAAKTAGTHHYSSGSMIIIDADNQLILLWHTCQEEVQVHVEFFLCRAKAGHQRGRRR
nr:unnamed protein product [Spirometra erinaceieuropaei]